MKEKLFRLTFFEYLRRFLRTVGVRNLSRRRLRLGAPRIACFPGDDIGDNIIAHGWYEDLCLAALFDGLLSSRKVCFDDGIALDVGANIGNHSLWFSRMFSRVIAFEPNPICTRIFEANVLMNDIRNVKLFDVGLSDGCETVEFFSNQAGNLGRSGVSKHLSGSATTNFPVDLVPGDSLLSSDVLGGLPVLLVKLDVEGHELRALRGLRETIKAFKPVLLFESHGSGGDSGSNVIVDQLSEWGYVEFYVVEKSVPKSRSFLSRLMYRILHGFELSVIKVDRPADRSYSMVVASATPL
jgi:FkbM family methyltransferase